MGNTASDIYGTIVISLKDFIKGVGLGTMICLSSKGLLQFYKKQKLHLHLNKIEQNTNIVIVALPDWVLTRNDANRKVDKTGIKMRESKVVNEFIATMKEEAPHFDLTYLYNNFKAYSITTHKNLSYTGIFIHGKNLIKLRTGWLRKTLAHELFHEASTVQIDEYTKAVGFRRQKENCDNPYDIGIGLNEGYTELLSYRYFYDGFTTYPVVMKLAEIVEVLVGKETMEHLYSKADLASLVDILSKYETKENVIILLRKMDSLYYYLEQKYGLLLKIYGKYIYEDVALRLSKILANKMKAMMKEEMEPKKLRELFNTYSTLNNLSFKYKFIHYNLSQKDKKNLEEETNIHILKKAS